MPFNQIQNLPDSFLSFLHLHSYLFHHTEHVLFDSFICLYHVFEIKHSQTGLVFSRLLTYDYLLNSGINQIKILWIFLWRRERVLRLSLFRRYYLFGLILKDGKVLRCVAFNVEFFLIGSLDLGHFFLEFDLLFGCLIVADGFGDGFFEFGRLFLIFVKKALIDLDFVLILNEEWEIGWHEVEIGKKISIKTVQNNSAYK